MLVEVLFYVFATILVAAALGVILSRNPVYSALSLVLSFVTSAAIWLLIEAEFLAIVLVLVYVGAVMVLFLFVVMMLDINLDEFRHGFTRFAWLGSISARGDCRDRGRRLGAAFRHRCHEGPAPIHRPTTAIRSSWARSSTRNTPIRSSLPRCCCWSRSSRPSR